MHYEAILFDMDGVLIDTRQSVTAFWQALAAEHQVQLTPADLEQHIYGCLAGHTLDILFPQLDAQARAAVMARGLSYESGLTYTEIPGAVALLRRLKRFGIPTALVTSGSENKVGHVSRQLGLDGLFAERVVGSDIQHGKPDPEAYALAAQKLHRPPEVCLVFEDSISGVRAAVAAGACCIGVQTPVEAPALLAAGAAAVMPDFMSIQVVPANNENSRWILRAGSAYQFPLGAC